MYAERKEKLNKFAREFGREPEDIENAIFVSLIVDEKKSEVERLLNNTILKIHALLIPSEFYEMLGYKHPFGKFYGLLDYIPTKYTKEQILEAVKDVPDEIMNLVYIAGTPEEIIQKFDEYAKIGVEHMILWNLTYFGDVTKIKSSYALIDEIKSHF
jgi:phthiodiolone/phenolphthiodiolone dimycocerosates ketoreductase